MSILGVNELLKLVKENKLVENLSERELNNPEGAGFDIRVGEIYKISGDSFLGTQSRFTPTSQLVAKVGEVSEFKIKSNEYFLVKTMETFNVPNYLTMHTFPRSTLHRSGVLLLATQTAPGYSGQLIFGLKNLGDCQITLELGSRIAHVQFLTVEGTANPYRGQWKGGRVTNTQLETQV